MNRYLFTTSLPWHRRAYTHTQAQTLCLFHSAGEGVKEKAIFLKNIANLLYPLFLLSVS